MSRVWTLVYPAEVVVQTIQLERDAGAVIPVATVAIPVVPIFMVSVTMMAVAVPVGAMGQVAPVGAVGMTAVMPGTVGMETMRGAEVTAVMRMSALAMADLSASRVLAIPLASGYVMRDPIRAVSDPALAFSGLGSRGQQAARE